LIEEEHRLTELRGVLAPIVTPFRPSDGEVDLAWIPGYIEYLHHRGCQGIVPCGTNGEAASLSVAERIAVTEAASAAARPLGMPVVVGTGACALTDAIALTRHAFSIGADAVLVMPPFYFKKPSDAGVAEWFRRLFDAAVPPGGRALLYHIPQTTGVAISDALLDMLLRSHGEVIYGLKDSTGDAGQLHHFREAYPQLAYFAGNDHRVAEGCAAGGAGSITAGANVFPDRAAAAQQAAWRGAGVEDAQARLSASRQVLDLFPLQPATKAALAEVAGLPETAVRPPQVELTPEQRGRLRQALKELS
jgi:4-hydroxy-tetrahydrodipicolinate synthase